MAGVGIATGFGRFTYALLLPAMTADVLGSYGRAGFLGTVNLGAYLAGLLVVSALAGRVSPVRLFLVGLSGSVAGMAILAIAPGFGVLVIGMALTGVSAAGVWVPSIGVVSGTVSQHRRGLALGVVTAGVGASIVVSGVLVALARQLFGPDVWRQVWAAEAALGFAILGLILFFFHSPTRDPAGTPAVTARAIFQVPRWGAITAAYAAFAMGYMLYISYLVAALEADAGFTSGHASTAYSIFGFTMIFGGLLVGGLSDRAGRRPTLVVGNAIMAGCALLILVGSEPWVGLSAVSFGILVSGLGSVFAAYVSDHLSPEAAVAAFGAITVPFGILQGAAPPIGGLLADSTGSFTATFVLSAGAFLVTAAAAAFLHGGRGHRGVRLRDDPAAVRS